MKKSYNSAKSFATDFQNDYKKYWDDRKEIEQKIKQLEAEKDQLFYPRLKEQMDKIAPAIQKGLKADAFEVSQHGGLSNRVSLWFTKGKPKDNDRNRFSNVIGDLCFAEYNDGEVALVSNLQDELVIDLKNLTLEDLIKFAKDNK